MSMTFTAPFAQTPKTFSAAASTALAGAQLGSGAVTNAQLLVTAGANGAVLTNVRAMPRATVTASGLMLFLVKAGAPNVYLPLDSVVMDAYTYALTAAIPVINFDLISDSTPVRLEAGDKIYAGTLVASASGIVFTACWMDY